MFFLFKQKTAYELRISDWSSDVCSSDLRSPRSDARSRIEGIGRPRVEPSFQPHVIDRMIEVKDAASFAAARFLSERLGRRVGPSTGTNLIGVIELAEEMAARGEHGSLVSLIRDPGQVGSAACRERGCHDGESSGDAVY